MTNILNFQKYDQDKAEMRKAKDLARLFMFLKAVSPEAKHLIPVFGKNTDRTVEDALAHWVKSELAQLPPDDNCIEQIEYLYNRFRAMTEKAFEHLLDW